MTATRTLSASLQAENKALEKPFPGRNKVFKRMQAILATEQPVTKRGDKTTGSSSRRIQTTLAAFVRSLRL